MSRLFGVLTIAVFIPTIASANPIVGQINTFETGTNLGWRNGIPAVDPVLALGGPAGPTDHFLLVTADGAGAASRLTTYNRTPAWTGDYLTPGVNAIAMDLLNPNTEPLFIRLGLKSGLAGGSPGYVTEAFVLPADGQWHRAVFLLDAEHLTAEGFSPPSLADLLPHVRELRILNSATVSLTGEPIVGRLGIDNIQALSVPEPASLALWCAAIMVVRRLRRARTTA